MLCTVQYIYQVVRCICKPLFYTLLCCIHYGIFHGSFAATVVVLQGEGEKAGIQEIKNDVHFLGNVRRRDIQKQICNVI